LYNYFYTFICVGGEERRERERQREEEEEL